LVPEKPTEVCHVKTQDFDIEMLVITARIKHYTIHNVLLDEGSGVNIITEELCRKLGYRKLEPAPFTIKMADQRKVTPLRILRDLRIEIGGFRYNITAIVMKMESKSGSYTMLLGRPWLKQANTRQD